MDQPFNLPLCEQKHREVDRRFEELGQDVRDIRAMAIELHESNALFKQALEIYVKPSATKEPKFWQTKTGERVIFFGALLLVLIIATALGINIADMITAAKNVTP